jgi:hypothetical protein
MGLWCVSSPGAPNHHMVRLEGSPYPPVMRIENGMNLPPGLSYIGEFLSSDEQSSLLQKIRELHFTHDRFRGRQLKRRYAQFGHAYVSTGRKLVPAAPLPDFLTDLIEKARPHTPARITKKGTAAIWKRDFIEIRIVLFSCNTGRGPARLIKSGAAIASLGCPSPSPLPKTEIIPLGTPPGLAATRRRPIAQHSETNRAAWCCSGHPAASKRTPGTLPRSMIEKRWGS